MKKQFTRNIRTAMAIVLVAFCGFAAHAQDAAKIAVAHVQKNAERFGLSRADLNEVLVTDHTRSKEPELHHIYMRQALNGIGIYKAEMSLTLDARGKVVVAHVNGIPGARAKANGIVPALTPAQVLEALAPKLGLPAPEGVSLLSDSRTIDQQQTYAKGNLSEVDIPFRLVYFPTPAGDLRLAWDCSIYIPTGPDWWSLKVDAQTGDILEKANWTTHCQFDHPHHNHSPLRPDACEEEEEAAAPPPPNSYNVYPTPIESPNYGVRSIVSLPWHPVASPYGWHDTNGANGAEYTITRGNNVLAQEDANGNNGTGYSPSGGATLDFNFPLNLNAQPNTYRDAAITNLFFWNNRVHDVWYQYGFDEQSGNFQQNNYGRGGVGNDYVLADAQDGSGTNNANFNTPPDGQSPRMQMYLWTGTAQIDLLVNSPSSVAGAYYAVAADFGPAPPVTPITRDLVLVNDGTASPTLGCNALTNAAAVSNKIAVIDRGTCTFVSKVQNAQNAGAVACIVCNNVAGTPIVMGGTSTTINIPSVMISQADCALLKAQMANGPVNASLSSPGIAYDRDGDFDNGVIAHEYGHGISNRLTGGPSNTNCLTNAEQMGEGWSDWFGLMMTIEPGDVGTDVRGIGTYVVYEPANGTGIRPAPYTTNMTVNPYTYLDIQNTTTISSPHGIGFLWCNMLWEMTWNLIDQYGFDPNLESGTGGNNIAMRLVMQALKLQPCNPGFVDGRNAILDADTLLYNGQYSCLIWDAFAKRGLGTGASQGSANSRSDGVQSFTRPSCAVALFSAANTTTCQGSSITFSDQSAGTPTGWSWNFGDGGTSTQQNPTYTYNTPGTFTVTLTVTVGASSNTYTRSSYITVHPSPTVTASIQSASCGNANGSLSATAATGLAPYTYSWSNGATVANPSGLAPGSYTVTVTDARGCTRTTSFTVPNAPGPVASVAGTTPASCGQSDGSATASATGGTGSISYTWSNGGTTATISGLAAGTYTVTATDANGCTSVATATVSNSSGPSASISSSTPTSCGLGNGAATVSATGGSGSLSYNWSNGATTASVSALNAGIYTVTVTDANNCQSVTSVNIAASTPPDAQIASANPAVCGQSNGSATATAQNGTGPYTYAWSNGATTASISALTGNTYTVTVTDAAGCTDTASVTIAAFGQPAVQVVPADLTCFNQNNGTCTANPSGGLPPYSYQWSSGQLVQQITGLPIGMYIVTVTDANGCNVIGVGVVNQPLQLQGFLSASNATSPTANDGSATASGSGGTTPYTYDWSNGGTTATISNLPPGTYTCTISDALGCIFIDSVLVEVSVGINPAMEHAFEVVPNPNQGSWELRIDLPYGQDVDLTLVNSLGQVLHHRQLSDIQRGSIRFDDLDLPAAVYHLRISSADWRVTKKVVVRE